MSAKRISQPAPAVEKRVEEVLSRMTLKERTDLLSGKDFWRTVDLAHLGLPSLTVTDGPHGVRTCDPQSGRKVGTTTFFPTGVSMAATWNPELIGKVGVALAEETRAMDCELLLGPCVNIVRHPLAGRNFETYSEDPYLAGRIGVSFVRAVQSRGIGTCLKHYACNNQELDRDRGDSVVDERTLREIYLRQFELIVKEAKPWTVMCAYNRVNGVYASQHDYLLNQILKGEWGYTGAVISDWGANHTITESLQGGLDLEMPGPAKYYGQLLREALRLWQIEETVIANAARRMVRLVLRCTNGRTARPAGGTVNTPAHQKLAATVAEEAITLLKNDRAVLPLAAKKLKTLAVIGPNAERQPTGGGSAVVNSPYRVTPLAGLQALLGKSVKIRHACGCDNLVDWPVAGPDCFLAADGKTPGLSAEFFSNATLSGKPVAARLDRQIQFVLHGTPPAAGVDLNQWSGRWQGTYLPTRSGKQQLKLSCAGAGCIYIDNKLVAERKTFDPGRENLYGHAVSDDIAFVTGRRYAIKVEYVKLPGESKAYAELFIGPSLSYDWGPEIAGAAELAAACDAAVVFAGHPDNFESEGNDRPNLELTGSQTALIRAVAAANKNTVVVVNAGAPVTMPWVANVPAIVLAYYPGMEGGNALARVLFGRVNPSGKLPVSFPKRLEDTPAFGHYPGGRQVRYGEGILVGYRHYDARDIAPLFPFGHGLSYTTFRYGALSLPAKAAVGATVKVAIKLTNTGQAAGAEVVQLYVCDRVASVIRPPRELKGFAKVALKPGQSKTVEFELDERAFAFYDVLKKQWVVEPGEFEIQVGSSSRDIRVRKTVTLG